MIIKRVKGDILQSEYKHIAFAINMEGINDSGFAGLISYRYWPELRYCGEQEMATVLTKTVGDKTFYALVCHSLKEEGWSQAGSWLYNCLESIKTEEEIACVAVGTGLIGQMMGANINDIEEALEKTKKKIVLFSL